MAGTLTPNTTEELVFEDIQTKHGTFTTTVPKAYKERKKWERPDPKKLLSFIPGTITEVCVKAGDNVKRGDLLLKFNAMKMANSLAAPYDGVIAKVAIEVGEVVPNGALLVEFE